MTEAKFTHLNYFCRLTSILGGIFLSTIISAETMAYQRINWSDLIPPSEAEALKSPPKEIAAIADGSSQDLLGVKLGKAPDFSSLPGKDGEKLNQSDYARALSSLNAVPTFVGKKIAIPGYLVPLEFSQEQTLKAFFLVPYYGACLHLPAPPPNQIIYAEHDSKIGLEHLYDPFLLRGVLRITTTDNELGTAAYTIDIEGIEAFEP